MECYSLGFTDNLNNEEDHIASDDEASNYDVDLSEMHKNMIGKRIGRNLNSLLLKLKRQKDG